MERVIQHIFPQSMAQALCHTLVHSLWEGLVLALLTGLIILLTRNSRAALRYRLLVAVLMFYAVAIAVTFMRVLNAAAGDSLRAVGLHPELQPGFAAAVVVYLNSMMKHVNEYAGMVSGIWLLLAALQNIRLLFGLYTLERLKKVNVKAAGRHWQEKTDRLSRALGIRQVVILLESAIAEVPLVIGYLKPVVLVPLGLINSLEPAQVEAILLHELAHIRRMDYLVNILQTILETFFFFNPAVRWLSWLIRTERENCCDDIVIAYTQNQIGYMQALVLFEEYRLTSHRIAPPRKAIALTGAGSVLGRLERISAGRSRSLGKLELIVLAVILVSGTVFIAASPRNTIRSFAKFPVSSVKLPVSLVTGSNSEELEAKKKAEAEAAAAGRTHHRQSSP